MSSDCHSKHSAQMESSAWGWGKRKQLRSHFGTCCFSWGTLQWQQVSSSRGPSRPSMCPRLSWIRPSWPWEPRKPTSPTGHAGKHVCSTTKFTWTMAATLPSSTRAIRSVEECGKCMPRHLGMQCSGLSGQKWFTEHYKLVINALLSSGCSVIHLTNY